MPKVALMLTGLARKVKEGYEQYWKHIIDTNDVDLYLHAWHDDDFLSVLKIYQNPEHIHIEHPFKFTEFRKGIESLKDDKSRPLPEYDVWGNFRCLPMFYSWQNTYRYVREGGKQYDCIIRSRYDLGSHRLINLNNLDMNRINISNQHWPNSPITDDNLCVLNQQNANILFSDIFNEFIQHSKQIGTISHAEMNFMRILQRKNLYHLVTKTNELPFDLLRDNKLWY